MTFSREWERMRPLEGIPPAAADRVAFHWKEFDPVLFMLWRIDRLPPQKSGERLPGDRPDRVSDLPVAQREYIRGMEKARVEWGRARIQRQWELRSVWEAGVMMAYPTYGRFAPGVRDFIVKVWGVRRDAAKE